MTPARAAAKETTNNSEDSNYKSAQLSKMAGEEALLMRSLVLILAIFLRKRRCFVQRMRLMSRQMRRMRRNVVILAIQRQNNIHRRKRKTMRVYPRPQFWFEQLAVNRYQDHLLREHFRVSRDTFEHICGLVGSELARQNTTLRHAISVEKRVAVALWRLANGNSYRTVGLTFGIGRCTAMNVKDEFCTALLRRANDFIKFPKTEAQTRQSIQEFQRIRRNCKTAKELGRVLQFVSHVYKHTRSKEPQGERLENNFARLFGRHLICHYTRCDWLWYLLGQVKPSCEVV